MDIGLGTDLGYMVCLIGQPISYEYMPLDRILPLTVRCPCCALVAIHA